MKVCSRCKATRELCEFAESKQKRDGLYSYCKECARQYQAAYRAANRDSINKWRAENADAMRRLNRAWRQENAGRRNAANALRYARQKRAVPLWANAQAISAIYQRAADLSAATGIAYEVDHIVPLQGEVVCGLHCEANLQVITQRENAAKRNRYWPDMPEMVPPPEMAATGANPGLGALPPILEEGPPSA
jgi:hypothetical protein